uniref:GNAT family N-acetyltransferase n=1 Tax=Bacteroides sp. TaxID=29523 RepID=UPI0025BCEF9D|nr:GNAT family N-acetyltransferase [Bacteroides sp.]
MDMSKNTIVLKPLSDEDINLFSNWLDKDYIYKWFCPDGDGQRADWLDEVRNVDSKHNHFNHFIVNHNDIKIGYCLYLDLHFEPEYSLANYGKTFDKGCAFEIGFLIGNEEYLNKGFGKMIVNKLEAKIIEIGGKEILADPDEENIASIKTLLSNGFIRIKDGDYRKSI